MTIDFVEENLGPKMLALSDDRWRRFAWLMACGQTNGAQAARDAGYSDHLDAAKVRAHHLMQRRDILEAIQEASGKVLIGLGPLAIKAAKAILSDPESRHHGRMIETVLDRTGFFAKSEHKVTVEHVNDVQTMALVAELALELGVSKERLLGENRAQKVIEGKVEEVKDGQGPGDVLEG